MTITEANSFLFSEILMDSIKSHLETLIAFGIVDWCEITTITYPEILQKIKNLVLRYISQDIKEEELISLTLLFNNLAGIKDHYKFIEAMRLYDMNMGWTASDIFK